MQTGMLDRLTTVFRGRIGARIALVLAAGLLLTFAVAGVSIYYLSSVGQSLRDMAEQDRKLSASIMRLATAVEQQSDGVHGFLLSGDAGHLETYATGHREFEDALADLESLVPPGPGRLLLENANVQHTSFEEAAQHNLTLYKQGGTRSAALIWQAEGLQTKSALLDAIDALMAWQEQIIKDGLSDSRSQQWLATFAALALVSLATVGGIVIGLRLIRSITSRVRSLVLAAENIKSGDMDTPIPVEGEDELGSMGQALASMVANLRKSRFSLERVLLQTERRNRELLTLNAVAATVSASLDLDEILDNTISKVIELMHADAGQVALLFDGQSLKTVASKGLSFPVAQCGEEPPLAQDVAGLAVSAASSVLVHDLVSDERFGDVSIARSDFRSLVCAALSVRDRVLGAISLVSTTVGHFDEADAALLSIVGRQVAVAIENARLYERSAEFAAVAERNRLAREIHDTLAQDLTGIILQLEAADQLLETNMERARFRLVKALGLTRESLAEARRSVWNLRPAPLDEKTLAEAIRRELERFRDATGVKARFQVLGGSTGLPPEIENGLFRIAQEALSNIRKHAEASAVGVDLAIGDGNAVLTVRDNGKGFGNSSRPTSDGGGFGLTSIQERVSLLKGHLSVESTAGRGTTIRAVVPIPAMLRTAVAPEDAV